MSDLAELNPRLRARKLKERKRDLDQYASIRV